jgi:radical SAM protein (TIGR01212 family)
MNSSPPLFPGGGRFRSLAPTLRQRFGVKVYKVTLRAGFGCPNRDGRVGFGGCRFCSPIALIPSGRVVSGPIEAQLDSGLNAMSLRHGQVKAIAYFQDGTATDAPIAALRDLYTRAIADPRVVMLAVGTRPDWLSDEVLDLLAELSACKPILLELGLQSASERLLAAINRNHTVAAFADAVERAHAHRLEVLAHVILDLPGETEADRLHTAALLNDVRIEGVKIHNLHVLADTPLAEDYRSGRLVLRSLPEYAAIAADFIERLSSAVVVHRLTGEGPATLMLAPAWASDKRRVLSEITKVLTERDSWQGKRADEVRTGSGSA